MATAFLTSSCRKSGTTKSGNPCPMFVALCSTAAKLYITYLKVSVVKVAATVGSEGDGYCSEGDGYCSEADGFCSEGDGYCR